jgi:hemerythrin
MENNNVLDYADIPQVAMNGVHRDELDIVNSINAAITVEDKSEITKLCEQWLEHTTAHFNKENAMMIEYGFPAYHCHNGEHNETLHELESVIHGCD